MSAASSSDISQWSVSQLKKEMTEKYGVKDFSECVEKGDLVEKLRKLQSQQPSSQTSGSAAAELPPSKVGNLTYGKTLVMGNKNNPTAAVVLSHGLGDSCDGWSDVAGMLSQSNPHLVFILPTAANQKVTLNMGMVMPSWYDIRGIGPNIPEDDDGIFTSAHRLHSFAEYAMGKFGIPHTRIVFGGFSQGGCISLAAGLTWEKAPAGVFSLSGYLGARERVSKECKPYVETMPILMCHGTADPTVPLLFSKGSFALITSALIKAKKAVYKEYPGMQHSACEEEIRDLNEWLKRTVPGN